MQAEPREAAAAGRETAPAEEAADDEGDQLTGLQLLASAYEPEEDLCDTDLQLEPPPDAPPAGLDTETSALLAGDAAVRAAASEEVATAAAEGERSELNLEAGPKAAADHRGTTAAEDGDLGGGERGAGAVRDSSGSNQASAGASIDLGLLPEPPPPSAGLDDFPFPPGTPPLDVEVAEDGSREEAAATSEEQQAEPRSESDPGAAIAGREPPPAQVAVSGGADQEAGLQPLATADDAAAALCGTDLELEPPPDAPAAGPDSLAPSAETSAPPAGGAAAWGAASEEVATAAAEGERSELNPEAGPKAAADHRGAAVAEAGDSAGSECGAGAGQGSPVSKPASAGASIDLEHLNIAPLVCLDNLLPAQEGQSSGGSEAQPAGSARGAKAPAAARPAKAPAARPARRRPARQATSSAAPPAAAPAAPAAAATLTMVGSAPGFAGGWGSHGPPPGAYPLGGRPYGWGGWGGYGGGPMAMFAQPQAMPSSMGQASGSEVQFHWMENGRQAWVRLPTAGRDASAAASMWDRVALACLGVVRYRAGFHHYPVEKYMSERFFQELFLSSIPPNVGLRDPEPATPEACSRLIAYLRSVGAMAVSDGHASASAGPSGAPALPASTPLGVTALPAADLSASQPTTAPAAAEITPLPPETLRHIQAMLNARAQAAAAPALNPPLDVFCMDDGGLYTCLHWDGVLAPVNLTVRLFCSIEDANRERDRLLIACLGPDAARSRQPMFLSSYKSERFFTELFASRDPPKVGRWDPEPGTPAARDRLLDYMWSVGALTSAAPPSCRPTVRAGQGTVRVVFRWGENKQKTEVSFLAKGDADAAGRMRDRLVLACLGERVTRDPAKYLKHPLETYMHERFFEELFRSPNPPPVGLHDPEPATPAARGRLIAYLRARGAIVLAEEHAAAAAGPSRDAAAADLPPDVYRMRGKLHAVFKWGPASDTLTARLFCSVEDAKRERDRLLIACLGPDAARYRQPLVVADYENERFFTELFDSQNPPRVGRWDPEPGTPAARDRLLEYMRGVGALAAGPADGGEGEADGSSAATLCVEVNWATDAKKTAIRFRAKGDAAAAARMKDRVVIACVGATLAEARGLPVKNYAHERFYKQLFGSRKPPAVGRWDPEPATPAARERLMNYLRSVGAVDDAPKRPWKKKSSKPSGEEPAEDEPAAVKKHAKRPKAAAPAKAAKAKASAKAGSPAKSPASAKAKASTKAKTSAKDAAPAKAPTSAKAKAAAESTAAGASAGDSAAGNWAGPSDAGPSGSAPPAKRPKPAAAAGGAGGAGPAGTPFLGQDVTGRYYVDVPFAGPAARGARQFRFAVQTVLSERDARRLRDRVLLACLGPAALAERGIALCFPLEGYRKERFFRELLDSKAPPGVGLHDPALGLAAGNARLREYLVAVGAAPGRRPKRAAPAAGGGPRPKQARTDVGGEGAPPAEPAA